MTSIRAHLILWLSLFLCGIWLLIATLTYFSTQSEIEELFDTKLIQTASILALIQDPSADDQIIKQEIYGNNEKRIAFQIWEDEKLVLYSPVIPSTRLSSAVGFSEQTFADFQWRVFHFKSQGSHREVYTAERIDVRNDLIRETTLDVILPLSIALPISMLMIWFTIGRALTPVNRIAEHVTGLSPQHLEAIEPNYRIPKEIAPLLLAINTLLAKLRTTFERERRFTADAAHELQTPLASIKTQVQVALRTVDASARDHALQMAEEAVNRTSRLVQQLLTLARYDPSNLSRVQERINLSDLLATVIAEFVPAATQKHQTLALDAPAGITLFGNAAGLHILFRNLLDNAIRYTPDHGKITVTLQPEKNALCVYVCDTGPGIPSAEQERIFERFYRGKHQQHIAGSGLGMSIVKQIADLHSAIVTLQRNEQSQEFCVSVRFAMTEPRV